MFESVIISTLTGSIICAVLLIFKNKVLSLLGGKALYYISLMAMLVFVLPMNIGDISLPKMSAHQMINVTESETTVPQASADSVPLKETPQEVPQETHYNVLPQASNMIRRSNPITTQEMLIVIWLLLDLSTTRVKIGELSIDLFLKGFNFVSEEYDERAREVGKMTELPNTVQKFIVPSVVKLDDKQVSRGNKTQSNVWYNKEKMLIDANIQFDTYNGDNGAEMEFYRIHTEVGSKMSVIDENTISAELYFTEGNNSRIDSFDAIITILPEGTFELKSTDGKYIIRGTAKEFVPQWEWTEEQKNAPVPAVIMINE